MARIRTIKPEFPQSESMGRCSRDARLLFILLWPICDDFGRTRAASRMLASTLYPYDDDAKEKIDEWLAELEREGCIRRYQIGGSSYLQIEKWQDHQKIDHPSVKGKYPGPEDGSPILANPREPSPLDQGPRTKEGTKDRASSKSLEAKPAEPLPRADDPALEGEDFPLLWLGDETSADRQLGWLGAIVDELPERDRKPVTDFTRMAVAGKILSDAQAGLLETLFQRHKPAIVAESNRRIGKRFPGVDGAAAHPVHGKAINRAMAARDDAEIDRLLKAIAEDIANDPWLEKSRALPRTAA